VDLDQVEPNTPDALHRGRQARITRVQGKARTERMVFLSTDARLALVDYLERERSGDGADASTALFLSGRSLSARDDRWPTPHRARDAGVPQDRG
jgi:site-specific recombinase XerD